MTRAPGPHPGGPRPVAVVGATGTGKSDLAIALAQRLGGEVVNCDSMQLYSGMDIGTAKVPPDRRGGIPHHLLDVLQVTETASVARFQAEAERVVEDLLAAGVTPILVGGSMLYVQSLIDRWEFPATDDRLRAELEERLERQGLAALRADLARLDPEAAAAILPTDPRRTVRALEVVTLTGRPFSASRPRIGEPRWGTRLVGVQRETADLDARLRERTRSMFEQGLVDEVRDLLGRGLREGTTARRAIGYSQVLTALDAAGAAGPRASELAAAEEETFVATRRYVRRQRSWFGRDPRIRWIDVSGDAAGGAEELTDRALRELRQESR